jgi:Ca2+-binding EF-hand superfamily protein
MGQKASVKEIKHMIKEVDINANGVVEFDEFVRMMGIKEKHNDEEAEIREAFK